MDTLSTLRLLRQVWPVGSEWYYYQEDGPCKKYLEQHLVKQR